MLPAGRHAEQQAGHAQELVGLGERAVGGALRQAGAEGEDAVRVAGVHVAPRFVVVLEAEVQRVWLPLVTNRLGVKIQRL